MSMIETRARTVWLLLLASAILWLPVLITLPMALFWRAKAQGTVYASHFRAVVRYCWVILLMPLLLVVVPSVGIAFAIGGVMMFILAYASLDGMRGANRGNRYKGLFA